MPGPNAGWRNTDPRIVEVAERVCTPPQLEALKLKSWGYGRRRIALMLNLSETAVRDRLRAAARAIEGEFAAMRGIG